MAVLGLAVVVLGYASYLAMLARRIRSGTRKVCLVVVDGMGFTQTADHGNLEATPVGFLPREGLLVDRHGERARFYRSAAIRDATRADGIAWQPPGLPERMSSLLFARGSERLHQGR